MDIPRRDIEAVLAQPVVDSARARWGFTNRSEIVTLENGDRVVVQRYGRREDAEYRLRVMRALWAPASQAGIAIPRLRDCRLDAEPPWVVFDALPGVPIPELDGGLESPGFAQLARLMGELLASFRELTAARLDLNDLWADPDRLAGRATEWITNLADLDAAERDALADRAGRFPALFSDRPVVLAHGDYAPVNVLTDGSSLTGLVDFESVRLADPLFDVAWWAWAVSFSSASVLEVAWPAFLEGAGIDASDPELAGRIDAIQALRMLELLAPESTLAPDVRRVVAGRLRETLR